MLNREYDTESFKELIEKFFEFSDEQTRHGASWLNYLTMWVMIDGNLSVETMQFYTTFGFRQIVNERIFMLVTERNHPEFNIALANGVLVNVDTITSMDIVRDKSMAGELYSACITTELGTVVPLSDPEDVRFLMAVSSLGVRKFVVNVSIKEPFIESQLDEG